MFFIGIFGISSKDYPAEDKDAAAGRQCSVCKGAGTVRRFVRRKYFHFFFIPLFFWGDEFFYRCGNCGAVAENNLSAAGSCASESGSADRTGRTVSAGRAGRTGYQTCRYCGKELENRQNCYRFCPWCGKPL
ncbi:MAG: zinc-ribbon domain-containing protein [Spirochaetia bacterium]|jgi:hypothetical protein|nr:zinc-ribbon domain-containing protein [Spirochaetia bacterium]